MSPYSGFSVFVAAHINMYGTIAPQRYPGSLKRVSTLFFLGPFEAARISLWGNCSVHVDVSGDKDAEDSQNISNRASQLTIISGEPSKKQIGSTK
jgi:hypothetical protein